MPAPRRRALCQELSRTPLPLGACSSGVPSPPPGWEGSAPTRQSSRGPGRQGGGGGARGPRRATVVARGWAPLCDARRGSRARDPGRPIGGRRRTMDPRQAEPGPRGVRFPAPTDRPRPLGRRDSPAPSRGARDSGLGRAGSRSALASARGFSAAAAGGAGGASGGGRGAGGGVCDYFRRRQAPRGQRRPGPDTVSDLRPHRVRPPPPRAAARPPPPRAPGRLPRRSGGHGPTGAGRERGGAERPRAAGLRQPHF